MKYIGLDYGTKRIGVAFSDEDGQIAFPHSVLENNSQASVKIKEFCDLEGVKSAVIGDPGDGQLQKEVHVFVDKLKNEGLDVFMEKEFMTSLHTDLFNKKKPVARKVKQARGEKKDESAAALILQRFLDKQKFK
jgi:putative Holliday junction resolvase